MRQLLIALVLTLALVFNAAPAHAAFGDTARAVAADIGCTNFEPERPLIFVDTAGACTLDNRRMHIVTFANANKQHQWHVAMREQSSLSFWWAESNGVAMGDLAGWFVNADNAANALNGQVFQGTFTVNNFSG